jgi:hypothetical protein
MENYGTTVFPTPWLFTATQTLAHEIGKYFFSPIASYI